MVGKVDGGHIGMCLLGAVLGHRCQIGVRVEVGDIHGAVAVVGRSTIDAVGIGVLGQTSLEAGDSLRRVVVRIGSRVAVVQALAEEDVVIGIDGVEVLLRGIFGICL